MPIILNGTTGITTPGITNTGTFTFQGAVELPAGTVSAPSLTTTGDTNTGIFFPAADTIAFTEGGTEVMRINSSGNVGIGTSSPGSALVVSGDYLNNKSDIGIINTNSGRSWRIGDGIGAITSSLVFWDATASAARMVINSSGNVGIGTSSPGYKLTVNGRISYSGAIGEGADTTVSSSGTALLWGNSSTWTNHRWYTGGGVEQMRLDNSGNLGLGVTPSAWGSIFNAMQLGDGGFIAGRSDVVTQLQLGCNGYYDGSNWKFLGTGQAARYYQDSGAHYWENSASGTAGGTISFTQAMTLTTGGLLQISGGSTNTTYTSSGQLALKNSGSTPYISWHSDSGTRIGYLQMQSSGVATLSVGVNQPLVFETNATERARITSGGDLLVGTTTSSGKLTAYQAAEGTVFFAQQAAATNAPTAIIRQSVSGGNGNNDIGLLVDIEAQNDTSRIITGRYWNNGTPATRFYVQRGGSVYNTTGTYGTISDEKVKQDIVDAPSQWDDIKSVRFRKYRMKDAVAQNENAPYLLGVVAQELEQVSPGLIEDGEIKTVKTSILLMKAAVALQEAMTRIEQLEAKVAALESK